jgi:hypothetical protein
MRRRIKAHYVRKKTSLPVGEGDIGGEGKDRYTKEYL